MNAQIEVFHRCHHHLAHTQTQNNCFITLTCAKQIIVNRTYSYLYVRIYIFLYCYWFGVELIPQYQLHVIEYACVCACVRKDFHLIFFFHLYHINGVHIIAAICDHKHNHSNTQHHSKAKSTARSQQSKTIFAISAPQYLHTTH